MSEEPSALSVFADGDTGLVEIPHQSAHQWGQSASVSSLGRLEETFSISFNLQQVEAQLEVTQSL